MTDLVGVDVRGYLESGFAELAVAGIVAGAAAFLLAEALLDGLGNGERDVLLDTAGVEQLLGGVLCRDLGGDPRAWAGEALVELRESSERALDPLMTGGLVALVLGWSAPRRCGVPRWTGTERERPARPGRDRRGACPAGVPPR